MAARYYCSSSAKFLSVDPLAGKYAHQSSYCYADCNPIMKNDPSGMGTGEGGDKVLNEGGGGTQPPNTSGTPAPKPASKAPAQGKNEYSWSQGQKDPSKNVVSTDTNNVGVTDTNKPLSPKSGEHPLHIEPYFKKAEGKSIAASDNLKEAAQNTLDFLPNLTYNVCADILNLPVTAWNAAIMAPEFLGETLPRATMPNAGDVLWEFQHATIDNPNLGS